MSASREKRLRKATENTAAAPKAPAKKGMSKSAKWLIGIVCAVIAVALIIVSVVFNTSWPNTHLTAATIGDYTLTAADFNYYYRSAYSALSSQYGEYAESIMAYMTEAVTKQALDYAHMNYSVYDVATKAGYTLTEEEKTEISETVEMFSNTATLLGFKNGDEYISYIYGKGCNMENYRKYYEMSTLVQRYLEDELKKYNPTDSDKETYYKEHKDELDLLTFRMYTMTVTEDFTLDEAKAAAQKMVDDVKADESSFDKNALEYAPADKKTTFEKENATLQANVKPSVLKQSISETAVVDWLNDAARVKGDATYLVKSDNTTVYVLYFVERDDLNYTSRDFRAILVNAGSGDDAMTKAKEEAQGYLDTYLKGDKTAEAFGKLADEKSDADAEGGLYESMGRSDLPEALEAWLYSADRKEGDTELVEIDSAYYVVYFVGEGDNYRSALAEDNLKNEYYNNIVAEIKKGYEASTNAAGLRYVSTTTNATYYE